MMLILGAIIGFIIGVVVAIPVRKAFFLMIGKGAVTYYEERERKRPRTEKL